MKRLLAIVLSTAMTLSLFAGCSSTPPATDNGAAPADGTPAAGAAKIGISMSSRDQWLSMLETAIKDAAGTDATITAYDAENDVQKQLQHIATCASQKFDAMIVNLVETNSATEIIAAAGDMPIVFVNRMPDEALLVEGKVHYVGSNEKDAGTIQGQYVADVLKAAGKTEINYVMLMGTLGLAHTTARTDFAKSTLEDNGIKLNKVFEDTADFDRSKAMEKMQQFLGTGKPFDVVMCNNDEMALGAIEAMKSVGSITVPVVGIDATANALVSIDSGEMACSVFQDAKGQGKGAYESALKLSKGETPEKITWIPFQLVDKTNTADFK